MAKRRVTDLPVLATAEAGDLIHVIDVSDLSGSDQGTSKQLDVADMIGSGDMVLADIQTNTGAKTFNSGTMIATDAVLNTSVSGTAFLDEDDLSSDSATKLASQQSIKAYVDTAIQTLDIAFKLNEVGGVTIGDVLYISGSSGSKIEMSISDNTDFSKVESIALAVSTEADNAEMIGRQSGLLEGLDTSSFSAGDTLYLSTAGAVTNIFPTGITAVVVIGHAVKISASTGSIYITIDSQTVSANANSIVRHQLVNSSTGTAASAAYTAINDASHRSSFSMVGSGYTAVPGIAESLVIYNEGYNKTVNAVDGNYGFEWWTDITDSHNLSSTSKMVLTADGKLGIGIDTPTDTLHVVGNVDIVHTSTESDDHALQIDVDAAGFGDVRAIETQYITGAIGAGDSEAVNLINIDETSATGGEVAALEVLATEGSAKIIGMLAGVLVNPVEQFSGAFGDMDSALVNATNRLTEFTTPGSNIAMFVADNDTVTIGNSVQFEEVEFQLATFASGAGVKPTFEYSTGVGTWASFTPTDGTNGFRATGVIAWDSTDLAGWAAGTGSEFLIRITRTQSSLSTVPIEDFVQIAVAVIYEWDKDGALDVKSVDIDASAAYSVAGTAILSDSSGTMTLSNVDALDATTSATISAAVGGKVKQVVNAQTGALATGTTTIPYDDTIPQNTEGDEYLTLAITPTSATNKLKIDVDFQVYTTSGGAQITGALFQDSTAGALNARSTINDNTVAGSTPLSFVHFMTTGTISSTTFKVRVGATAGTVSINGDNGVRRFGGAGISSITITETEV
jgi:hypothetical protein